MKGWGEREKEEVNRGKREVKEERVERRKRRRWRERESD